MSQEKDYPAQLIERPLPTLSRRRFTYWSSTLKISHCDAILSRDLFSVPRVTTLCSAFSRAAFLDLRVTFVPRPTGSAVFSTILAAWTPCSNAPATRDSLSSLDGVECATSGSTTSACPPIPFQCDFEGLLIVPLIKPAPVEGYRARLAYSFTCCPADLAGESLDDWKKSEKDTAVFDVFFSGTVFVAGAA